MPAELSSTSFQPVGTPARNRENSQGTLVLALIICSLLNTWYFARMHTAAAHGLSDFSSFYTAGMIARKRPARELFSWKTQAEFQRAVVPSVRSAPLLFNHLPYEALIFIPLSYLSFSAAYDAWFVLRMVGFLIGCALVIRHLRKLVPWAMWFAMAALAFPALVELVIGQDTMLLFLSYAIAFDSFERKKPFHAGFVLALSLFKYQLVLPFILAFVRKKARLTLAGFASGAVLILAVSLMMIGPAGARAYVSLVHSQMWNMPEAAAASGPTMMPNGRGLIFAAFGKLAERTTLDILTIAVSAVLLLGTVTYLSGWYWNDRRKMRLAFCTMVVVTLLVSYHAHIYDLTMLIIPAFVIAEYGVEQNPMATLILVFFVLGAPTYMVCMYFRVGFLLSLILAMMLVCLVRYLDLAPSSSS